MYRFRYTASYLSKFTNFAILCLHLAPPLGVTPFELRKDFLASETRVPGLSRGVVSVILRLAFLVEFRLVTDTDRQTERQTHRHRAMAYTAQSIARAVKTELCCIMCRNAAQKGSLHNNLATIRHVVSEIRTYRQTDRLITILRSHTWPYNNNK